MEQLAVVRAHFAANIFIFGQLVTEKFEIDQHRSQRFCEKMLVAKHKSKENLKKSVEKQVISQGTYTVVYATWYQFLETCFSWMTRQDAEESAFQCSDDVYDMKICGDSIICGLRNGTVEIWSKRTLKKEFSLEEQQGSVQVIFIQRARSWWGIVSMLNIFILCLGWCKWRNCCWSFKWLHSLRLE